LTLPYFYIKGNISRQANSDSERDADVRAAFLNMCLQPRHCRRNNFIDQVMRNNNESDRFVTDLGTCIELITSFGHEFLTVMLGMQTRRFYKSWM